MRRVSVSETVSYLAAPQTRRLPLWREHASKVAHTSLVYALLRALDTNVDAIDLEPILVGILAWAGYFLADRIITRRDRRSLGRDTPLEWIADAWVKLPVVLLTGAIGSAFWAPLYVLALAPWTVGYIVLESMRAYARQHEPPPPPAAESAITHDYSGLLP